MDPRAYIVADLHVDYWDDSFPNSYPCGTRHHHPLVWGKPNDEDTVLVVAGDVSDNMDTTIQYISSLTTFYNEVLFIDGNHESCVSYPELLSDPDISSMARKTHNAKIHFLADGPFTKDGIAYVGRCGWWDYVKEAEKENEEYFSEWMPHLDSSQVTAFHENVGLKATEDYAGIVQDLIKMENCKEVERIILVTHTIPHRRFCNESGALHHLNTLLEKIDSKSYPKLDTWIFGHVHEKWDTIIDGVRYIANPRGRMDDYRRIQYGPVRI